MKLVACVRGWLGVLACAGVVQAQTARVVDLPTRPGITQRVLVVQPEQPTAVLVLMSGGNGHLGIRDDGRPRNDGNFVVLSSTILAASRFDKPGSHPVQEMALDKLRFPVLVAHHEQDQCVVCPPSRLPALMARLPAASRLLTFQGGVSVGDPCRAFAHHGYNGIESQVVAGIAAWVGAR